MAEEISETVKTSSDGFVKLTIEKYEELMKKAAEKPPVINRIIEQPPDIINRIIKTPEMAAADNKLWGIGLMVVGGAIVAAGAITYAIGRSQAKALVDD